MGSNAPAQGIAGHRGHPGGRAHRACHGRRQEPRPRGGLRPVRDKAPGIRPAHCRSGNPYPQRRPVMTEQARILVVDDIPDNRELLCRLLSRQGHATAVASNGAEALDMIAKSQFDCVLLDIMMPVMGGIETLSRLKDDDALRHVPVIVVSAIDDIDNVVKCIELGAEDYLYKPVNRVILNARVSASLEKKRLRDKEQEYMLHVRHELELGRQIQADFLPEELPQPEGWEVKVLFAPAFEVAGDFYDAFMLGDNRLCFMIADVCGKGVGAALFMALVRSLM